MQEKTYYVKGMHCAACEVLIEKKLLEIPGIKAVNTSTAGGQATIEYDGEKPGLQALNDIFKKDGYSFFENQITKEEISKKSDLAGSTLFALGIAVVIIVAFLLLDKLGISGLFNIGSKSSLISFFGFGILAGLSSCVALMGGMVLSLSKQWNELYLPEESFTKKLQPHVLFNIGRVFSYGIFGAALGLIGSRLSLSFTVTAWLVICISVLMIGVKTPPFFSRHSLYKFLALFSEYDRRHLQGGMDSGVIVSPD